MAGEWTEEDEEWQKCPVRQGSRISKAKRAMDGWKTCYTLEKHMTRNATLGSQSTNDSDRQSVSQKSVC